MKLHPLIILSFFSLIACANEVQKIEKQSVTGNSEVIVEINEIDAIIETLIEDKDSSQSFENENQLAKVEKNIDEVVNNNIGEYISTSNKIEVVEEEISSNKESTKNLQKIEQEAKAISTISKNNNSKQKSENNLKKSSTTANTSISLEKNEEKKELELVDVHSSSGPGLVGLPAEIHSTWDELTRKHISASGKVNYIGFKSDKAKLEKYIDELQSNYKDLNTWSRNKRLAYWINTYNAVTVKLIVDNYPVKSIQDLKGGKPWDAKLITLGGKDFTLNEIENNIIRPRFKEPRIHFAVNCAAISCPKILNRAWTEDNIQRYLTKQTKAFLANTSQNTITENSVKLSKIFDWYKADFGTSNENVIKFINKYSETQVTSSATVTYNNYNWGLNK